MNRDTAAFLNSIWPISAMNEACRDGALLKALGDTLGGMADKVADACAAATDVSFIDSLRAGSGNMESAPEVVQCPKLGRSGVQHALLAGGTGDSALGTHSYEPPSQATFASLSGQDLAHVNGIRDNVAAAPIQWDRTQYSQADIGGEGRVSSVGVGTNYTQHQQNQAEQLTV